MRYYIVWLKNNVDVRDDEPIKIKTEKQKLCKCDKEIHKISEMYKKCLVNLLDKKLKLFVHLLKKFLKN